jgi:7 transmembrane receptor (Secretin family)
LHMTHFGELLWNSDSSFYIDCAQKMKHKETLDMISEVSCATSLVALTGVFLTAIVFPEWLKGAGQKITLQMAASLALLLTVFEVAINTKIYEDKTGCGLLGFILHYALLSNFCWMAVAGYLQYHRLVTVLYNRTPKLVFKAAVIGWGVPIIPGAMVLITIQFQVYSGSQLCLPQGFSFYATILAPLTIILVLNATVFGLIAKNLFRMFEAKVHVDKDVSIRRFKQLLFLFTLFGLNWSFGVLQIFNPALRVYFAYVFSISIAVQGVAYFAFFVLMHDKVRKRLQSLFSRKDGISDTSFMLFDSSH